MAAPATAPARSNVRRLFALATSCLFVVLAAWAAPRAGFGQANPPGGGSSVAPAGELLKVAPFDRITLLNGTVLNVEPLSPRPLPPYDTKKARALMLKRKEEKGKPPEGGNVAVQGKKKEEEPNDPEARITIHALEGENRDFRVKRLDVKEIEYFEDMLLAECERLVKKHDFARAFEHLLAVQQRDPHWPKLDERVNHLLFEEGKAALRDGDSDRGLRLLGELHARQNDYPGLADELATAYSSRAEKAFDLAAYPRGRQILHELETLAPDHDLTVRARDRFVYRAKGLAERAAKKEGAARLDDLTEALRVWPALEGAGARYEEAFRALPTLDVAVLDLPRPVAPWVRSPAQERVARLVYLPLLYDESEDAVRGGKGGQLLAGLESADLGRRLELNLRSGVNWNDGSRTVAALDIVRALSDRTDPRSAAYNARWADLLLQVVPTDDSHVEVRLTRPILKPEAWLLGPLGPAHAAWDGWVTTEHGRQPVGDGPFQWDSAGKESASYTAAPTSSGSEGSSPGQAPKITRLREVRFASATAALAALVRGDVTMVAHLAPDRVATLEQSDQFKVGHFTEPSIHVIALDGRNPVLRNRTLRRALSYAIDRKLLLEENVLKRPADDVNLVADGPFAKGSYADAPSVRPLGYDPLLAKMLVAAARKEMGGGAIKLTFEYPATPEAQAAVPKIAEAFRKVDVAIELVERPESDLEESLRSGRRFDLAYRAVRCAEPVFEAGPLICPGYDAPARTEALAAVASPRILELLLQLERAAELPSATGLTVMIDRESRDELPVIPLWQLQDHYAWRTRLQGPAAETTNLYQGVEKWEVAPWFAKDPW